MSIATHLHLPTLERPPLCSKGVRRATFKRSSTWHFSTQGLPMAGLATDHRELLPPVFTLTLPRQGGYFLWHFLAPVAGVSRR